MTSDVKKSAIEKVRVQSPDIKGKCMVGIDAAEGDQPQALAFKARERLTPTAKQA